MLLDFKGERGADVRPARQATGRKAWAKDPSTPGATDGTVLDATFVNDLVAMFRQALTTYDVTVSDGDDTALATLLAKFATLASPHLTGTPTAPTAAPGTNTTQIANTAFVAAAVAALVNSSPGTLDTLNELAAALGNDANFAATVTTSIGTKLAKSANLSDLANAATARSNLGVAIGVNVQAYSASLTSLGALDIGVANLLPYVSGANTWGATTLSAFARTLLDDGDAATALATLGVGTADSPQFATPAAGSNTTNAATTAFVASARPVAYAIFHGVNTGNSAATNTTNLDALFASGAANGIVVQMPPGIINLNALATITGNASRLIGTGSFGAGATQLRFNNATGDCLVFANNARMGVSSVYITAAVRRTSGWAVRFTGSPFRPIIEDVEIDYHFNGVWIESGANATVRDVTCRWMLGTYGMRGGGVAGVSLYGATFFQASADNPMPLTVTGRKTWSATTSYVLGDIIEVNGGIWQCTQAGTSGASAPSGIPGTGASDWTSTDLTDGSAKWRWCFASGLLWLAQDSNAYSFRIFACDFIRGYNGFAMVDSLATGSSYPVWCYAFDLECDHSYGTCVEARAGQDFHSVASWFGSSLTGHGFRAFGTFGGSLTISKTRVFGNWLNGILLSAGCGPKLNIEGNLIAANSQAGSGANHGIAVAPGVSDFKIIGNDSGLLPAGSGSQGYAVLVNTGASDHYVIALNGCRGNVTGAVSDGGTGTNKYVAGNIV